jgi:hypothetical protein
MVLIPKYYLNMKSFLAFYVFFISATFNVFAQADGVAINKTTEAHESSMLDVESNNKGFLLPALIQDSIDALPNISGMLLFNTTTGQFNYNNGVTWLFFPAPTIGYIIDADSDTKVSATDIDGRLAFYTGQSGAITKVSEISGNSLDINYGPGSSYLYDGENLLSQNHSTGSISSGASSLEITASQTGTNTAIGGGALSNLLQASTGNTAAGVLAGNQATGDNNVFVGKSSGVSVVGSGNTALGINSLPSAAGDYNTVAGASAGSGFQGNSAIFIGYEAASTATLADSSIAIGASTNLLTTQKHQLNLNNIIYGDTKEKTVNFWNQYSFPASSGNSGEVLVLDNAGQLSWSGRVSRQVAGAMADLKPFDLNMSSDFMPLGLDTYIVRVTSFADAEVEFFSTRVSSYAAPCTVYFGIYNMDRELLGTTSVEVTGIGRIYAQLDDYVSVETGQSYYLSISSSSSTLEFLLMNDTRNRGGTVAGTTVQNPLPVFTEASDANIWIHAY